jgi:hypothetical protein
MPEGGTTEGTKARKKLNKMAGGLKSRGLWDMIGWVKSRAFKPIIVRSNSSFILLQLITSPKSNLSQRLFIGWQAQASCEITPEHAEWGI